jgi:hypothetical protein
MKNQKTNYASHARTGDARGRLLQTMGTCGGILFSMESKNMKQPQWDNNHYMKLATGRAEEVSSCVKTIGDFVNTFSDETHSHAEWIAAVIMLMEGLDLTQDRLDMHCVDSLYTLIARHEHQSKAA